MLCVVAATDTGLIGHNDHKEPGAFGGANYLKNTVDEFDVLLPVNITPVNVDDAVTIEK